MTQNRKLTELMNIGKKIAGRLNEVGIFSEDELRIVGAAEAHRMIKERYPKETLPVCYYLYPFEGALCGKHWDDVARKESESSGKSSVNNCIHSDSKKRRSSYLGALLFAADYA